MKSLMHQMPCWW